MNDDVIFERSAQAWLEVGPVVAPDRVVQAALHTIESTPQQRDLRIPWRFTAVKFPSRLGTAAVVAILVIAAGFLLVRNQQSTVGGPSPTPVPTPSPSMQAALQATWGSVGTRPWPGVLDQPTTFDLGPSVLRIPQLHVDVDSAWSLTDDNSLIQLDLQAGPLPVLKAQRWNCQIGQMGLYSFAFSGGTDLLTLRPVSDPCMTRAAILAGDWTRTPCQNGEWGVCPGPLPEGRHFPETFKPFGGGTLGHLAYTVPAGWADLYVPPTWTTQAEPPSQLSLWRQSSIGEAAIVLYANVEPSSAVPILDSPPLLCGQPASTSARTASQIADWLASRPYLSVTAPTPVSIGGLTGVFVDVSVMPGWVDPCNFIEKGDGTRQYDPWISVLRSSDGWLDAELNRSGMGRARYILLDRDGGAALLIKVDARAAGDFEGLLADAMPVIESFEFSY